MTHRKQTLFLFIGCIVIVLVIKMAADYKYVLRKEKAYRNECTGTPVIVDSDRAINCKGDTIPYTWQILKRK
jgi:hypothetical protein